MTYKEAALRIEDHMLVHKLKEKQDIKITEALGMAIEAMDKQNPKNIVSEGNDESDWVRCPRCNEILGTNEDAYNSFCENDWQPIYCHKCGQALVWEKT